MEIDIIKQIFSSVQGEICQKFEVGWKFGISNQSFQEGVHFWNILYRYSNNPEGTGLSLGIATLPVVKESIYTSKTKWLYRKDSIFVFYSFIR